MPSIRALAGQERWTVSKTNRSVVRKLAGRQARNIGRLTVEVGIDYPEVRKVFSKCEEIPTRESFIVRLTTLPDSVRGA